MNFLEFSNINKDPECASCMEDFNIDNYVLYKDREESDWKVCQYCSECIQYMINEKWGMYIQSLDKADCAAAFRRILEQGPPISLRENSIKCDNENSEVYKFYFFGREQSAKLKGSLTGNEREKWLIDQKMILELMENVPDKKDI